MTEFSNRYPWIFKTPNVPQANATIQFGVGFVATTAAATGSGAFFEYNPDGNFYAVAMWSGVRVQSAALTIPTANTLYFAEVVITSQNVKFYLSSGATKTLIATVGAGGNAVPMVPTHIPLFARVFNGAGVPSDAPQLFFSYAAAVQMDANINKLWPHALAGMQRSLTVSPVTPFLSTLQHVNSTSPASATLNNTTSTYAATIIGGRFQFAAPLGAATDYIVFAYLVPTGYQAIITGVSLRLVNTGAAVATTATILDWSIAVNSSAVSLATTDSPPTSWGPSRIPIGIQSFIVGAAIGTAADEIVVSFDSPVCCESGRYFHLIVQAPVGTATASQVLRGDFLPIGYFQ
jgi:hypothetical protein